MAMKPWPRVARSLGWMPYPPVSVAHAASGPLRGLRFGVKDVFHVAGYPTSMGQPLLAARGGVQHETAPLVQLLLDAGAQLAGKTITDELAFSMTGHNVHYGQPINGAAPTRITGGSSTGSAAAVSHGEADFALGTDTGGSVRAPANHCGLWGLRPTHGRVSCEGVMALAPSFDTCGWLARDAKVFARVSAAVLGVDGANLGPPRWLWPTDLWSLAQTRASQTLRPLARRALRDEGHSRVTVMDGATDEAYWAFRHLQGHEVWQQWGAFVQREQAPLGGTTAARMRWAQSIEAKQVREAKTWRRAFSQRMDALLGANGVLLVPTMPDIAPLRLAPEASVEDYRERAIRMLCVAGLAGLPQVNIPLASRLGAPLGLSLIGPRGSDAHLVAWALALAQRV